MKLSFVGLLAAISLSNVAFGQEQAPTNVLKAQKGETSAIAPAASGNEIKSSTVSAHINTFYVLLKTLRLGVDFTISDRFSLGVNTQIMPETNRYSSSSDTSYYYYDTKVSRFDLALDSTIMLLGKLHTRGLYISPAAGYSKVTAKIDDVQASLETPFVEMNVGYQWVWGNFKLAVGGGPTYHIANKDIVVKSATSEDRVKIGDIVGLSLDTNVGFVF